MTRIDQLRERVRVLRVVDPGPHFTIDGLNDALDVCEAALLVIAARKAGIGNRVEMHAAIDKMEAALARMEAP